MDNSSQDLESRSEGKRYSLAQHLPFDILQEIFIHSLPTSGVFIHCLPTGGDIMMSPNPDDAPLLLCHVCAWWRKAGFSMPFLWRELYIDPDYIFDQGTGEASIPRPALDLIHQWHERAKALPLRCRFDFGNRWDTEGVNASPTAEFVNMSQISTLERMQHIELISELPNDPPINALSKTGDEGFPNLESLLLWANRSGLPHSCPLIRLHRAPRLRKVILHNHLQLFPDIAAFLPWAQLTHLVSECFITGHIWHQVLRYCVNLEAGMFYLMADEWIDFDTATSNPIAASSLQSLTLFLLNPTVEIDFLFSGLHFPSLQSLQISGQTYSPDVSDWDMATGKTPGLKELYIGPQVSFGEPELFYSSVNRLLPNLEILIIDQSRGGNSEPFTTEGMASFVEYRSSTRGLATLKKLVIMLPHPDRAYRDQPFFLEKIPVALQGAVADGLDLVVQADGCPYREIPYPDFCHPWYQGIRDRMIRDYDIQRL